MSLLLDPPPEPWSKPAPAPVKVCWDCKWRRILSTKCRAPQNLEINLVTGLAVPRVVYCANHRDSKGYSPTPSLCGPEGKWWEPRR